MNKNDIGLILIFGIVAVSVLIAVILFSNSNHIEQILEACAAISKSTEELQSCIEGLK